MQSKIKLIIIIVLAIIIGVGLSVYTNTNKQGNLSNAVTSQRIKVITTTYPLYEFSKFIIKDRGYVELLLPFNSEVHEWEPTVKDIERLKNFDLIIYNSDKLEHYVPKITSSLNIRSLDTASDIMINNDPHVWLDPSLAKEQVKKILNEIVSIDPSNEAYYKENAKEYIDKLDALDEEFKNGLRDCETREFIVLHSAYLYLAKRYNLTEIPIIGVDLEGDVQPNKLKEIVDIIKRNKIDTIYAEEGIDSRVVETLAKDTNVKILKLTPIEVIKEEEFRNGVTYLDKMKSNLENLRIGLKCK